MAISAVGTSTPLPSIQSSAASGRNARAADGDYNAANSGSAKVQDSDGDYKPLSSTQATTASSTQAASSSATQAALSRLKLGG